VWFPFFKVPTLGLVAERFHSLCLLGQLLVNLEFLYVFSCLLGRLDFLTTQQLALNILYLEALERRSGYFFPLGVVALLNL
jgi:hypothetical protein